MTDSALVERAQQQFTIGLKAEQGWPVRWRGVCIHYAEERACAEFDVSEWSERMADFAHAEIERARRETAEELLDKLRAVTDHRYFTSEADHCMGKQGCPACLIDAIRARFGLKG